MLRLPLPPPTATDTDWWVVPIGGGVTHWCPACAVGHVDELLDAGAWTIDADDADYCEPCGRGLGLDDDPDAGLDLVVACDTGD